MTAQGKAARYVCRGCGSEGLLREDEDGRARCPHCGRAVDIAPEREGRSQAAADPDAAGAARLLPAG